MRAPKIVVSFDFTANLQAILGGLKTTTLDFAGPEASGKYVLATNHFFKLHFIISSDRQGPTNRAEFYPKLEVDDLTDRDVWGPSWKRRLGNALRSHIASRGGRRIVIHG